ncbi:uncharacterized protein LOC141628358 [Silene latifolia]|uniref:uncharacterized protein LOC141628358 n=1 Tax=Silene latifolia TaxID=37657 RepID=UPI003D77E9F1
MEAFRSALDECALGDLGYYGNVFTWQRGNGNGMVIRERLDRAVATMNWCERFPSAVVRHFPLYSSDHCAILIHEREVGDRPRGQKGFKFEPFWMSDPECDTIIQEAWDHSVDGDVIGKVQWSSQKLRAWARNKFGCLKREIKEKEAELERWQKRAPSADMLGRCRQLVRIWRSFDKERNPTVIHKCRAVYNRFVREWWDGGGDMPALNQTLVVLIPKCKDPKKVTEFRPISLCNVLYKIISKTMANRLKGFLDGIITENQSAFTPGRLITDNALVAFEIFHTMKRGGEGRKGNVALKLDMSKAYDRRGLRDGSHSRDESVSGCTGVSHLFFADDSILFVKANNEECSIVANIISNYERASGQKINFEKSKIVFSKKVGNQMRGMLKTLLGVREVDKHENYLGLPTIIGRSKKVIFTCLKEKIWNKMKGWKENLLSKPGKEILIKAVAQEIPTYMMSLFAIPEGIVNEIQGLLARFWWGSTDAQRKLHWMSWDRLCEPKADGGMGFKDLKVFNQAFLAKQIWGLFLKPCSLVGRVLKARYFKNGSVLDARRGYDPIFSWRSLWGSKSLLLEGLKWRVGNGQSIGVWDESWLPGETAGRVPMLNIEADPNMKVAEFIDVKRGQWNTEPTKDGNYTVRSGYWVGRRRTSIPRVPGTSTCSWKQIWQLNIPPKLTHFVWKIFANILPVRMSLFLKHCCPSPLCNFCPEEESSDHALFGCTWTRHHWDASGFGELVGAAPNSSCEERITWILHPLRDEERGRFLAIVWSLWTIRNQRLFEESPPNENIVCWGFVKMVSDYRACVDRVISRPCLSNGAGDSAWSPPRAGFVKINTDAYMAGDGSVGLGAVARDKDGRILWLGCWWIGAEWSVEVAEAKAAMFGLDIAKERGMSNIVLECDALNLVRAVRDKNVARTPVGLCVEDICTLLSVFESSKCCHVKRGGNIMAHCVARISEQVGDATIFVTDFPQGVLAFAEIDLI